jgi:hypothetical protein
MGLCKNIAHSYQLFPFPTHQTETGKVSMWETNKINPLGPIKLASQTETRRSQ